MANIQGQATGGVSPIAQAAAAAALTGPMDGVATMRAAYAERAAWVAHRLAGIPGLTCHVPRGAFYVFPGLAGCLGRRSAGGRALGSDADVAGALLDEQRVAAVPGVAFGMSPYLRLSVAADPAMLAEACRRLESFCSGIS
jgi:aspartate aminotransferase